MTFDLNSFDPNHHRGSGGSRGGDPLPPGKWVCWVKGFKRKEARGKNYILFLLEPVFEWGGDLIPKDKYEVVFESTFLTAAAAWRLADLLRAVGHNDPININSDRELSRAVLHVPIGVAVENETYQGKTKPRVTEYVPLSAGQKQQAAELLEERATQEVMSGGGGYGGGGYAPAPQGQTSPPQGNGGYGVPGGGTPGDYDDDIPF